jgi:esterase
MTSSQSVPSGLAGPDLYRTDLGSSGPRVLFCHGLFGQGKNWTTVARALATDFRVTLVDLPNHGRSGWTPRLSYAETADAVAQLLATPRGQDAAYDEQVSVVGHSMGGKVAMALALRHPALVERLCVVDIAPVHYPGLSNFADYVRGMRALDLATLTDRASADAQLQPYVPDPTVRSFLLQNLRRDGPGWRWQMNLAVLGDHLDDLADWPDLHTPPYPGPTLWIGGADSDYITSSYAPRMRQLFPKVQLVRVKNAGHWVHSEQPDIFLAALRRFLSR